MKANPFNRRDLLTNLARSHAKLVMRSRDLTIEDGPDRLDEHAHYHRRLMAAYQKRVAILRSLAR
jgi:hypothetical protein